MWFPKCAPAVVLVAAAACGGSHDAPKTVTFNKDVAPIVFQNCASCHRPGEIAPFSLLDYKSAVKHAKEIGEETEARTMPPWLPEPGAYPIVGDRRLRQEQIDLIQRWVAAGAPEGDPKDLPAPPVFPGGWQYGTPDLVVTLAKPYTLKPSPRDVYRNLVIHVPLDATKYVRAVEFKTGGAPVHHAVIRVDRTSYSRRRDGQDGQPGYEGMSWQGPQDPGGHFVGWAPGRGPIVSPEGLPWRLDRGADLVVEAHLIPSDEPVTVQPTIGLFFTDVPPARSPLTVRLAANAIDIAPGDAHYMVTDAYTLPIPVELMSVLPHAHYLGKDMRVTATLPSGEAKTLLHIPRWEFHWQQSYRYVTPIPLPAGTTIEMRYVYDNSDENPENPMHPPVRVRLGPNSTDEMGELGLQVMPQSQADGDLMVRDFNARIDRQLLEGAERRVKEEPRNAVNLAYLAELYLQQGRAAEAVPLLQSALAIDDKLPDAHNDIGNLLMAEGRIAAAIPHFRRAVALAPNDERLLGNLGNALARTGRAAEAETAYRRALAVNPDYTDAHVNLAALLFSRNRVADALPHLQKAVELEPNSADLLNNLASGLAASGRLPEALQTVRRALAIDPNYAPAIDNLQRIQRSIK